MIGIITYDIPHRKTQDLLAQLIFRGVKDIQVAAIPFVKRAKPFRPVYAHRPSVCAQVAPEALSKRLNIGFDKVAVDDLGAHFGGLNCQHIIIAGAGLLPADLVNSHPIINGHPGYLPEVKGLDALKWALLEGKPLGVTTHFVSPEADEGKLIQRKEVPLYRTDDFYTLAMRMYEIEIALLAAAPEVLNRGEALLSDLSSNAVAHRRMPNRLEPDMMKAFEERRASSALGDAL